jgi:drug/metabolite transporter (DMT)-like permease
MANLNVLVILGSLLLVSGIILIFLQRNTLSSSILLVPGVALCLVGAGHH